MEDVDAAIEETTAEAIGSSVGFEGSLDLDLEGEAWIALAVRERMAFWDFFVPKARPRLLRAERYYRTDRLVLKSGDI